MKQLAAGESVEPLYFREGDYWQDLAQEFNAVLERVNAESERWPSNTHMIPDRPADDGEQDANGNEESSTVGIADAELKLQSV